MNNFKKLRDDADLFLGDIPKSITRNGFIVMLALMTIILVSMAFIHYPERKVISVIVTPKGAYGSIDYETYKLLKTGQVVTLDMPVVGMVTGILDTRYSVISKDRVLTKLVFKDKTFLKVIRDSVIFNGNIVISDKTLIEKLLLK